MRALVIVGTTERASWLRIEFSCVKLLVKTAIIASGAASLNPGQVEGYTDINEPIKSPKASSKSL